MEYYLWLSGHAKLLNKSNYGIDLLIAFIDMLNDDTTIINMSPIKSYKMDLIIMVLIILSADIHITHPIHPIFINFLKFGLNLVQIGLIHTNFSLKCEIGFKLNKERSL